MVLLKLHEKKKELYFNHIGTSIINRKYSLYKENIFSKKSFKMLMLQIYMTFAHSK